MKLGIIRYNFYIPLIKFYIFIYNMEDFKKIGKDVKDTVVDLYNKPSEGIKNNGLRGGIKGLGSAVGNVVEHCFTVPVDITCVTYNAIANKLQKNEDKSSEDKSSEDKSSEDKSSEDK